MDTGSKKAIFMLHQITKIAQQSPDPTRTLHLVPAEKPSNINHLQSRASLTAIAARRCSAFFAEAAVLVLVFGILDYLIQKGRIELLWIAGAFAISVSLLIASIIMDFTAHRWVKVHP